MKKLKNCSLHEFYEQEGESAKRYHRSNASSFALYHQLRLNTISRALNYTEGESVIDIGAGEGVLREVLESLFEKVVSLDIAQSYLRRCSTKYRVQASLTQSPFKKKSFDLVVACDVLEHIPDLDTTLITVKELARKFVLISLPLDGFHRKIARSIRINVKRYDQQIGHLDVRDYTEAKQKVSQYMGGKLIYEEGLYVTPKLLVDCSPYSVVEKINRLAYRICKLGLNWVVWVYSV